MFRKGMLIIISTYPRGIQRKLKNLHIRLAVVETADFLPRGEGEIGLTAAGVGEQRKCLPFEDRLGSTRSPALGGYDWCGRFVAVAVGAGVAVAVAGVGNIDHDIWTGRRTCWLANIIDAILLDMTAKTR